MWVRRSAIRPIPRHARVPESALETLEASFAAGDERACELARAGFDRLHARQRALSGYLSRQFSMPLDEAALALGRRLSVSVFLAFEAFAGSALRCLGPDAVAAAAAALDADEELRRADPRDPLESEDIIAMEQPALLSFVHEHVDRTLDEHAASVDVDDVGRVFRTILVEILALSHAVAPPLGYSGGCSEEPLA